MHCLTVVAAGRLKLWDQQGNTPSEGTRKDLLVSSPPDASASCLLSCHGILRVTSFFTFCVPISPLEKAASPIGRGVYLIPT